MHRSWLFILFTFFILSVFSQNNYIKSTDKYVELVNNQLADNVLIKKAVDTMSTPGVEVKGHYLKKKLVLITTHHGGEFGYVDYFFYIKNDSLLFINEKKISLKEPVNEKEYSDYEKYVIFNTDKNGHTDLTKWPLTVNLNSDFYLLNKKVIKYQLKNFDKPLKVNGNEIEEITKDLITRYTTCEEELK